MTDKVMGPTSMLSILHSPREQAGFWTEPASSELCHFEVGSFKKKDARLGASFKESMGPYRGG